MPYSEYFRSELKALPGRELMSEDGIDEEKLSPHEARLGHKIPASLRTYYAHAGNLDINREHNRLYPPDTLVVMDEKLVFMEENQCVVYWGFRLEDLPMGNPEVYQGVNADVREWFSEELDFSTFIIIMWKWQRDMGPAN